MSLNKRVGAAKRRPRGASPFSKNLADLLKQKHMTVREAAQVAGVGASTVQSWKNGALPEDYRAVRTLAKHLGVSFSFILTGEDDTRGNDPLNVTEVFQDGELLFDGFAKISIQRLVLRKREKK